MARETVTYGGMNNTAPGGSLDANNVRGADPASLWRRRLPQTYIEII